MINARKKGHSYELAVIKMFRDLGWDCVSSRSESKRTDDLGIDICYTDPFAVQCKAVEKLGSLHDVLAKMPDKKGTYNLVFHKRKNKGSTVTMSKDTFFELLEMLLANKIITP